LLVKRPTKAKKDKLKEWEEQGHIRIFMRGEERMIEIISVPED
jgi:phage terminase large subunit-like protein